MFHVLLAAAVYFALPGVGTDDHGRVIELSHGAVTVIYKFCPHRRGNCYNGSDPVDVVQLADGSLFGATRRGGPRDRGVLFQLTPSKDGRWKYSQLWYFCESWNCDDGGNPRGSLKIAKNGDIIGFNTYG